MNEATQRFVANFECLNKNGMRAQRRATFRVTPANFSQGRRESCLLLPEKFVPQKRRATRFNPEVINDSGHFHGLFHRGFLGQRILDRVHDTSDGTLTKTEAVP